MGNGVCAAASEADDKAGTRWPINMLIKYDRSRYVAILFHPAGQGVVNNRLAHDNNQKKIITGFLTFHTDASRQLREHIPAFPHYSANIHAPYVR